MPPRTDILELIRRARSGDEAASAALVLRLEPFIKRVIRIRMGPPRNRGALGRELGSSDVCQLVLRSLFQGLRRDQYRFDKPSDLMKLLKAMVRFRVATESRRSSVKLRELVEDFKPEESLDSAPRPDQEVADRDLIEAIQNRFSEDELELLTMWLDDAPWADVGLRLGCTADAARVRLARAVARVRDEMVGGDHAGD